MTLSLNKENDEKIIAVVKAVASLGADVSLNTDEIGGKVDRTITISYRTHNLEAKTL